MKKALILGDSNSIFVKQYIEHVLLGEYEIVLLQEGFLSETYQIYYIQNGIHLEPLWQASNKWTKRLPIIRSLLGTKLWANTIAKKYGVFDLIQVHGLSRSRCEMAMSLRKTSQKTVLTVWGSDLLRRSANQLQRYKNYYESADCITVATDQIRGTLYKTYGDFLSGKTHIVDFPLVILDLIDGLKGRITRKEICEDLGIVDTGKINVFIGHNGRDCQRHVELTEAMSELPVEIKKKINLVYTMTYGVPSQPYLDNLKKQAAQTGCQCTFIEGYQSEENIAKLRLLCDILLHAQPTDAASASFFECMYVGAICLNGRWLPYPFIEDYHNRVIEYDEVPQITAIVKDIVEDYCKYKEKYSINEGFRNGYLSAKENAKIWKQAMNI